MSVSWPDAHGAARAAFALTVGTLKLLQQKNLISPADAMKAFDDAAALIGSSANHCDEGTSKLLEQQRGALAQDA